MDEMMSGSTGTSTDIPDSAAQQRVEHLLLLPNGSDKASSSTLENNMETVPLSAEPLIIRRQAHTQATIDETYTDQSETRTACDVIHSTCRQISPKCLGQHALDFFPIVGVVRTYPWREWLAPDVISGLSVGFLQIPQGLGAGFLASLSPVYGLYTSFFPTLVYLLFGTSPHVSMGSNSLVALLTADLVEREADSFRSSALGVNGTWTAEDQLQYKVGISAASCFVAGVILLSMGLLRLGFITSFLGKSFVQGFTFSAAVHVATRMLVEILYIKIHNYSGFGKLVRTYVAIFQHISESNVADVLIGLVSMVVLIALKASVNRLFQSRLKFPIPVDLIVIAIATLISHLALLSSHYGVGIVGDVPTGLAAPTLPAMGSLSRVAADAFVTAILIFALTISLAKLTAKLHDISIDDNQEMVAYGLCSLLGAFFQNFPACTALPRTMMLSSLGARSTLNGVTSAVFILLVLLVAGPLFSSLPIATLGALIILAMKDLLLQIRNLKSLWHVNKADCFIWVVTAVFSVFGDLDIGLLVGVVFSMVTVMVMGQLAQGRLLGKASHEDMVLTVDRKGVCPVPGVKIFRFESALYFATQERFKNQLYSLALNPATLHPTICLHPPDIKDQPPSPNSNSLANADTQPTSAILPSAREEEDHVTRHVILDCSGMTYIDVAGVDMLKLVMTQFSRVGVDVWLAEVPAGTLGTLERAGFVESFGKEKMFYTVMDALHRLRQA